MIFGHTKNHQEWLETAKELGRPIPEARGRLMFA